VAEALTYPTNNRPHMNYGEYRRQGMPVTSSLMESTVKQVSRRVKGTENSGRQPVPTRCCSYGRTT
jgi:hypothetical protein